MTSLHAACLSGNHHIVELLMENKAANMTIEDHNHFLPIHYAIITDSVEILEVFFRDNEKIHEEEVYYC